VSVFITESTHGWFIYFKNGGSLFCDLTGINGSSVKDRIMNSFFNCMIYIFPGVIKIIIQK